MTLDVFLMNMCIVVIALLIRREIKLKKSRQIMKTQVFKEHYIPNIRALVLLLMLLLCLWLPLTLRFFLILQGHWLYKLANNLRFNRMDHLVKEQTTDSSIVIPYYFHYWSAHFLQKIYIFFSLTTSNYVSFLIKATVRSHFIKYNFKFMVDFSYGITTDS